MSFSSKVTLFRTEDATVNIRIQGRQAAQVQDALLVADGVSVQLEMRAYPEAGAPIFEIETPNFTAGAPNFWVVEDGLCRLTLPQSFWDDKPWRRFSMEVWTQTPTARQRCGTVLIDTTDGDASPIPGANRAPIIDIDRSGTIALGGAAQWLAPANPNRVSLTGESNSVIEMWISENGQAAGPNLPGSYLLKDGQIFKVETKNAISIYGANTGQAWAALEKTT
jgi:hypothetical protein